MPKRKREPHKKMYGYIVKEQLKKLQLSESKISVPSHTLKDIKWGRNALRDDIRKALSKHLELPILEIFPPDIGNFSALLNERFDFEIECVKYFIKVHKKLHNEILRTKESYKSNIQDNDSNSRGLADRMLHSKIIFTNPDIPKRDAIFLKQISYTSFVELWIPHLNIDYFKERKDNIANHEELFQACLDGNAERIQGALETHRKNSLKDVQHVLNFLKTLKYSREA